MIALSLEFPDSEIRTDAKPGLKFIEQAYKELQQEHF
jgi:hypothetical protein